MKRVGCEIERTALVGYAGWHADWPEPRHGVAFAEATRGRAAHG